MSRKSVLSLTIVLATVAGATWMHKANSNSGSGQAYAQQAAAPQISDEDLIGAERLSKAFRTAAKVLKPSVVQINALVETKQQIRTTPFSPYGNDLLEEFFGGGQVDRRIQKQKVPAGVGSGVIVSADGYVLTNNHVVQEADELQVELSDGRIIKADVVGTDPRTDLAVLKINAAGLSAASLGDSSQMEVGDWVIAIGSPFGLEQSVTAGIISATNRQTGIIESGRGYEDFFQTDAAINPGNSGGPLINLRGEVIGINTAINSKTGTNIGIGFAIPSNMAKQVLEDLKSSGRVIRGFMGASLDTVNVNTAKQLKLPTGVVRGAFIGRILPNGPAARASLKEGDVIVSANGRPVATREQLINMVAMSRPGSALELKVFREGQAQNVKLIVDEQTPEKMSAFPSGNDTAVVDDWGVELASMSPQIAKELGVSESTKGAVIVKIAPRSQASQLKLEAGDILVGINGEKVPSASRAKELLSKINRNITLNVQRGNLLMTITASTP
ncbi:MAG: Do family serine endopeptidase [Pirellulales bacterium]